jgi:hypothetical protein
MILNAPCCDARPVRPRLSRAYDVARTIAPPIVTFLGARLLVVAAAVHAHKGYPGAADLSRADSYNYVSIAVHGYILHPCPPRCVSGVSLPWSGNSGWFPLYPLVLAPFVWFGEGEVAGAVVSAVCQLCTFALLWFGFVRSCPRAKAVALMVFAAVFPGTIYLAAVFPLSMLTLVFLGGLLFLRRGNARAVVASAFFATLVYPLGCLYGVATFIAARRRSGAVAVGATIGALGLLAVAQRLFTGHWNAYLLAQASRGHGLHDPLPTLLSAKSSTLSFLHQQSNIDVVPALQTTLVVIIVTTAVVSAAFSWRSVFDRCVAVLILLCWAEPLVLGGINLYRTDIALLPAVLLFRRLPAPVIAAFVVIAATIAYWMSVLYFQSRFV